VSFSPASAQFAISVFRRLPPARKRLAGLTCGISTLTRRRRRALKYLCSAVMCQPLFMRIITAEAPQTSLTHTRTRTPSLPRLARHTQQKVCQEKRAFPPHLSSKLRFSLARARSVDEGVIKIPLLRRGVVHASPPTPENRRFALTSPHGEEGELSRKSHFPSLSTKNCPPETSVRSLRKVERANTVLISSPCDECGRAGDSPGRKHEKESFWGVNKQQYAALDTRGSLNRSR